VSQSPITIYVGAGNLNAPHYRFFLDEAGSSEITDLTLLASQTYTFKRLGASNSHPFYISDSGYEKPSSGQLILTGDGDYENGITGDQSFTLSFSDPSTAPSLSLDFYCTSHSQMIQEVEIKTFVFNDNNELKAAVNEWCDDEAAAREKYGDINNWDVSNITNFSSIFSGKTEFNSDISNWDVSNGTDFAGMFQSSAFDQDISDWDVSSGEYFQYMFNGNPEFSHQGIRKWKIDYSDILTGMFSGATKFLDNGWQVSPTFKDFNITIPTINSANYESKASKLTLKGVNFTGADRENDFGVSSLVITSEDGNNYTLVPSNSYLQEERILVDYDQSDDFVPEVYFNYSNPGYGGKREDGITTDLGLTGLIRDDGNVVVFNNASSSYVVEADAVALHGSRSMIFIENADGSIITLGESGDNFRNYGKFGPEDPNARITSLALRVNTAIATYDDGTVNWNGKTWPMSTPPSSILNATNIKKIVTTNGNNALALHEDGTLTVWGAMNELKNLSKPYGEDGSLKIIDINMVNGGIITLTRDDNSMIVYPGMPGGGGFYINSQYYGGWFDENKNLIDYSEHPANLDHDWNGPNDDLKVSRMWNVPLSNNNGLLVERSDGYLVQFARRGVTNKVISTDWGNDYEGNPITLVDVYSGCLFHLSNNSIFNSLTGDFIYQPTGEESAKPVQFAGTQWVYNFLLDDGTVVGNKPYPGDLYGENNNLSVEKLISYSDNFIALRSDGSVITWGSDSRYQVENLDAGSQSRLRQA